MGNFIAKMTGGAWKKITLMAAAAAVAAVALGLVVRGCGTKTSAGEDRAVFELKRGELVISLHDTGDLQAKDSIKVQPEVEGELTIVEIVDEGSMVKKDDFLMKFDSTQLERQVADGEIDLENSMANLLRAQEQKKIQELTNETNLAKGKLSVDSSRMEFDKYGIVNLTSRGMLDTDSYLRTERFELFSCAGIPAGIMGSDSYLAIGAPRKCEAYQAFRDAELEIARSRTQLEQAERNFDNMDKLLAAGFVTRNDYIRDELAVLEAGRNLESTQLKQFMLRTYTYPKTLAEKKASRKQAEDQFRQTEIQTRSEMTQKEAAIKESQSVYDMKKTNLEKLKEKLSKMVINAPDDGLVLYGDSSHPWHRAEIRVGSKVYKGMTVLTIPKVSNMIAATKVMERNVNKVKVDQKALVTLPALPGVKLAGKVSKISSVASASGRWFSPSDVKTFDVEVTLEESDPRMKPGMSCEVDIFVDTLKDVLYVPVNAVFRETGKDVCYVVSRLKTSPVEVKLGEGSELYVEIKEGLNEEQKVLLYSAASAGQGGAAVEKDAKDEKGEEGAKPDSGGEGGPGQPPAGAENAGRNGG